jgi:hypothetical protein
VTVPLDREIRRAHRPASPIPRPLFIRPATTDTCVMTDPCWIFTRGDHRLEMHRQVSTCELLIIEGSGSRRGYEFRDVASLVTFQTDMEAFLVNTGWSLTAFYPERRRDGERRTWPRRGNDRRRWWTDVLRQR